MILVLCFFLIIYYVCSLVNHHSKNWKVLISCNSHAIRSKMSLLYMYNAYIYMYLYMYSEFYTICHVCCGVAHNLITIYYKYTIYATRGTAILKYSLYRDIFHMQNMLNGRFIEMEPVHANSSSVWILCLRLSNMAQNNITKCCFKAYNYNYNNIPLSRTAPWRMRICSMPGPHVSHLHAQHKCRFIHICSCVC